MTRVVTDGAADLPEELIASAQVTVVRGPVHLGDRRWQGDVRQFWADLEQGAQLPATQAPSVEQLVGAYRRDGPVLAVHVAGELSRTVAHAREAAAATSGTVRVVDTRSLSVGTGLVALAAARAAQAGADVGHLEAMTVRLVDELHVHALIDDARLLVQGGRAGLVAAKLGRHTHRHVVAVKGHVIPIRQLRHRSEAIRELIAHVREHATGGVSNWAVGHGDASDVDEFVERLASVLGCEPSYVTMLGAPVGSHVGPRSLVVGFFSEG